MRVRESGPDTAFNHVAHRLLRKKVRDRQSQREGELMAVVAEPVRVNGLSCFTEVAYIRGADGREFTADPTKLEQL
ncbi:hypothetical protein [Streptomyces sp. NPDC001194]|uniref:hypothetical protein n=1 Tax=Streptomyces sp. NPDC001194 TaxID=3364547 RepID=UPI0036A75726